MIELAVYNREGKQVDTVKVDESTFGSIVRRRLLHQAVVMYQKNRRQGTVATKSRGMVEGSTRKLYRQKGTGHARASTLRTCVRRGGGVAFAKVPRDFSVRMPKAAKRLARDSALLSKMLGNELLVLDSLQIDQPRTKDVTTLLKALKVEGSCLIGVGDYDRNVYLSTRNIERTSVMPVAEFNAYEVLSHKKVVVTRAGFEKLTALAAAKAE
jgi:large subunit ribosomal protein L4